MENQTRSKSSIAFIVELFLMFAILLLVIVVITRALMLTRNQSLRAKHLTEAVIAAENTAEACTDAKDPDEAGERLAAMECASKVQADGNDIDLVISYDGDGRTRDTYLVHVSMDEEKTDKGRYQKSMIKVSLYGSGEELYTLTTGSYERSDSSEGSVSGTGKNVRAAGSGNAAGSADGSGTSDSAEGSEKEAGE